MSNYEMRVIPKKDADGNVYWTASFPAVEGCVGGGSSEEDAIGEAKENLKIYLDYLEKAGQRIPDAFSEVHYSGKIALRVPKSTHRRLMDKAEKEGMSLNSLINGAIEHYLGISEYDYKLEEKISEVQRLTLQSLNLQKGNYMINQQLLWKQAQDYVSVNVEG